MLIRSLTYELEIEYVPVCHQSINCGKICALIKCERMILILKGLSVGVTACTETWVRVANVKD